MTLVKQAVFKAGILQALQSGDYVTNAQLLPQLTNDNTSPIVIGQPVYSSAADHVNLAEANASGTKDVLGLVADLSIAAAAVGSIQTEGILTATTAQWDAVAGTSGGLTYKTTYYLDPANVGKLTSTPTSTAGQYSCPLGIAMSTTEFKINIGMTILM